VETFIRGKLLAKRDRALTPDTALVKEGLIDSMGQVILAAFVEERFGVTVDDADVRAGALDSIREILAFVDRRRDGGR
jgi:acyl carrier protein